MTVVFLIEIDWMSVERLRGVFTTMEAAETWKANKFAKYAAPLTTDNRLRTYDPKGFRLDTWDVLSIDDVEEKLKQDRERDQKITP